MVAETHLNAAEDPHRTIGTEGGEMTGEVGRRLYTHHWMPSSPVPGRRPVIIVHGFGEHLGRYGHVSRALAGAGHEVWALDLRGHGRSEGPRADVGSLGTVLASVDELVARVGRAAKGPTLPVLFGHSMGGAFAAAYSTANSDKLGGLVLSAPAVHLALRPTWQGTAVAALARLAPRAGVGRIDPADLSHDPAAVRAFVQDSLVWHGRVPARTAVAMYDAGRCAFSAAPLIRLPVYVVQGEDDRIVPMASTARLFHALGSEDKELVVLEKCFHEPHHETIREGVLGGLLTWLGRR